MENAIARVRSNQYVENILSWVMQHKRQVLVASQWVLLGLGLGFSITTFDASGKCYVVPCITGKMASMYKVNSGMSFQVLVTGFLFCLQPAYGLWFMRVRCTEHVAGMYIGSSAFTMIMALFTAVLWGTYSDMISSIEEYEREGNLVVTNRALRPTFSALCNLSILFFLVGSLNVVLLTLTRELWSDWHELDDIGGEIDGTAKTGARFFTSAEREKAARMKTNYHNGSAYQGISDLELEDDDMYQLPQPSTEEPLTV